MSAFGINYPDDMKDAIKRLGQTARSTDEGVRACGNLDAPTRAAWGDFLIGLLDFVDANQNPGVLDMTSALMARVAGYARQLYEWQQKIAKACPNAIVFNPDPSTPSSTDKTLGTIATIAQWTAIAAIAVGGAYALGQVFALVPHPAQRANPLPGRRRRKRIAA